MADELFLPSVPEPQPDDSEDVSWALSTAEAMWARGDHAEGIKWLRKAAEAASDADQDVRALQLAKAASDLASMLARRSAADQSGGHAQVNATAPTPAAPAVTAPTSGSAPPAPVRSSATPPRPPQAGRSSPPLPSKASQPPAAMPSSNPSPSPSPSPSKAPRPPASLAPGARPSAAPRATPTNARVEARRARRRSRENLDEEGRVASLPPATPERETARDVLAGAGDKTTEVPALQMQVPVERTFDESTPRSSRRKSRPDDVPSSRTPPPPISSAKTVTDLAVPPEVATQASPRPPPPAKRAADWDHAPTQSLSSADLEEMVQGDRMTAIANKPASIAPPRPPSKTVHDEALVTTQAVRVVVWRDGNGVHVAPAGTVVSAITVDAVLVGLAPETDLTAWLSRRDR